MVSSEQLLRALHRLGDDAVDDDDERPRWATDLHRGAAQGRNQKARDDGRPQTRFGLEATGDRKGHGQRQGHDAHRGTGPEVEGELVSVVTLEVLQQTGAKRCG